MNKKNDGEKTAISVVIPVYNQEKYVAKCIRSVLCQSFPDFEIILVNDGSTDRSLEICQKFAKEDGRISIIDKQNEGVAYARKDGVLKAEGDYVLFLDSDDYLDAKALEVLYQIVCEKRVDVAVGNYDVVYDNWGILKKSSVPYKMPDMIIDKDRILPLMLSVNNTDEDVLMMQSTGRLYRRSCIMRALDESVYPMFPSYNEGEDVAFNLALAPFLSSIWVSNAIVYHYRYGGITSRDFASIRNGGHVYDDRYDCCVQHGLVTELPWVFNHYSLSLMDDVVCQFHYHVFSAQKICDFIQKEMTSRKIVVWARHNPILLPANMRKIPLVNSLLDCNVNAFLKVVKEREEFLRKHHYWKTKILKCYQGIVDVFH